VGEDGAGLEESADEEARAELIGGERVGGLGRGKVVEFHGETVVGRTRMEGVKPAPQEKKWMSGD
jgi:hypothetical protein